MGILDVIWIMRFQMDFQILTGFVANTTDTTFEILVAFMGAHMTINQKARWEILSTDPVSYTHLTLPTIYSV